jgi:hypothetical protein
MSWTLLAVAFCSVMVADVVGTGRARVAAWIVGGICLAAFVLTSPTFRSW